jgi:hypothetical protein
MKMQQRSERASEPQRDLEKAFLAERVESIVSLDASTRSADPPKSVAKSVAEWSPRSTRGKLIGGDKFEKAVNRANRGKPSHPAVRIQLLRRDIRNGIRPKVYSSERYYQRTINYPSLPFARD